MAQLVGMARFVPVFVEIPDAHRNCRNPVPRREHVAHRFAEDLADGVVTVRAGREVGSTGNAARVV